MSFKEDVVALINAFIAANDGNEPTTIYITPEKATELQNEDGFPINEYPWDVYKEKICGLKPIWGASDFKVE